MQAVRRLCLVGVVRHPQIWRDGFTSGFQAIHTPFPSITSSRSYSMSKNGEKKTWTDQEESVVKGVGICEKQQPVKNTPSMTVADITLNHNTGMLEDPGVTPGPIFQGILQFQGSPALSSRERMDFFEARSSLTRLYSVLSTVNDIASSKVSWEVGEPDVFPYVWLRDNCRCPACFHAASNSRTHLMQNLDLNTQPKSVQVLNEGKQVDVVWNDGHRGTYPAAWLHLRAFNTVQHHARAKRIRLNRSYWGAKALKDLPQASFDDLLKDDTALMVWLQQLEIFGFVIVNGAPAKPGQVRKLAERIGFIKKTHYGEDFSVKAKPDPSNVAYLSGLLQLHTDLPYYQYKPGVQFIHCIVQYEGIGGESLVSDAVHVAQELQRLHPEKYHILTQTPVDWFDVGTDELGEFNKILQMPMICTDDTGEIRRINMSQPQRDSFFSVPAEMVASWYDAMVTYHRLLSDPRYCLQFKMIPGTILTFDNLRIVHGRTGYMSGKGERHVEGCYIDWDEVRSRRRVLEDKLEVTEDCRH